MCVCIYDIYIYIKCYVTFCYVKNTFNCTNVNNFPTLNFTRNNSKVIIGRSHNKP